MYEAKLKTIKKIRTSVRYASINYDADTDPELTPSDKDLLVVLSIMAGDKKFCWPAIKYMCLMLDLNPATNERNVRRRLAKLEQLGYITRHQKYANTNGTGRQTSNTIVINYTCSKNPISESMQKPYNPWDIVFFEGDNTASKINLITPFTPPRNIYSNITYLEKKDSEIHPQGRKEEYPHSLHALSTAFAENVDYSWVDAKKYFKPIRNWFKRPCRYFPSQKSGFVHIRSKYGEIGLPERKVTYMDGRNKNLTPLELKEIEDFLGITFERSVPAPENLSPKTVDNPVDRTVETIPTMAPNGCKIPSWTEICNYTHKHNAIFQHWMCGLSFIGIYNERLSIRAQNPFWKDKCEQLFVGDLLRACKELNLTVKSVEFKLKD